MSEYLIVFIFFIILVIGSIKKVNCFSEFMIGAKEGLYTTVNMFGSLLTFSVAISFLFSSGIIEFLEEKFDFEYGLILIQMIIRPISSSSSLSIMMQCYESYGVDSLIGLLSTGIHYVSDASLYIIPFYCSLIDFKKYDKLLILGIIVNVFSYIVVIIVIVLFNFIL